MRKLLLTLIIFLLAVPAFAEEGESEFAFFEEAELLLNPEIAEITADGKPIFWEEDAWITADGYSYFSVDADGYSGDCLHIESVENNDARFIQTVEVTPGQLYKISCMARAEGVSNAGLGANISIKSTFVYSNYVYDTQGEWTELVLYVRPDSDTYEMTICARLGGYSGVTTGKAWFDSFSMEEVSAVADGLIEYSISVRADDGDSAAFKDDTADAEPRRHTEAWLLSAFGMALAAVALIRKTRREKIRERAARWWLAAILAIALALRIFLAFTVRGYHVDINCFASWSERMFSTGFTNFYSEEYFCDYPPAYMALGFFVSAFRQLFGIAYNSPAHIALLKVTPIICDIGGAYLIYRVSKKRLGAGAALALTAAYALNPAIFVDSAAWGQIDSVFTILAVLGAVFIANKKYWLALPLFALAMLTKPQALLFAPLGLAVIIADICRDRFALRRVIDALIGLGAALVIILCMAVVFHERGTHPVTWLINLYTETTGGYPKMVVNALNIYTLLDLNWAALELHPFLELFAWFMFATAYAYTITISALSKRASSIFVCGAALIMLICAFGPMIHERYVFPAIILLMLAYAVERDKHILISASVLSITLFLNQILVLQGGMTPANYGHLSESEGWLNSALSLIVALNALYIAFTAGRLCLGGQPCALKAPHIKRKPKLLGDGDYKLNLKRLDYIILVSVTLAYSILAFVNLGTPYAPQTSWVSSATGDEAVIDLGEVREYRMLYYGGLCNTTFTVELSNDGENWTEPHYAIYDQGEIFRWLYYVPCDSGQRTLYEKTRPTDDGGAYVTYASVAERHPYQISRYVRIKSIAPDMALSELGFQSRDGALFPATGEQALIDEQHTVPDRPSYFNSTYFDEIYHARTAYEHLNGIHTYEWTHPPLGKVLMMCGIEIFGMSPFGWRFMGALMGVLMLPVIYLMAKQLGLSTKWAAFAMALLALDSMHFTQTRIATIDSYAVFFIMLMYLFMFRYVKMSFNRQPLGKTLVPLMLCGVTMGCAWATKWIGLYASAGLAILFFWSLISRLREYFALRRDSGDAFLGARHFWGNVLATIGVCVVCFIIIPCLIYYFSYYWQLAPDGGLSVDRVVDLQENMLNYHSGLGDDDHTFRSPWYQWPVIAWPMWFYSGSSYVGANMVSSISCMGNPAIWWIGLAAVIFALVYVCWKRYAPKNYLIVVIGFLSQYLPWVLVPRSTFIYHYFASVPFMILIMALCANTVERALPRRLDEKGVNAADIGALTVVGLALVLFIAFYPLESGLPVSREYARLLRWFNWYNY